MGTWSFRNKGYIGGLVYWYILEAASKIELIAI